MCLSSGSNFQLGWEVDGGVGSKGLTDAKKVLNSLWRVTPALQNILLHRLDLFTGSSRDEMDLISICGAGEILWSRYTPKCAIISFFVKYYNPLYFPLSYLHFPSLPLYLSKIGTLQSSPLLGVYFNARFRKENINHSAGWESRLILCKNKKSRLVTVAFDAIFYQHSYHVSPSSTFPLRSSVTVESFPL